jgi:RHS repeat-associated protein
MPTTTNYIWDEQNYLAEADGTNMINVVYTNEPQQYGNLISSRISGTTSYHHFDGLGSTRQLTNASGVISDTIIFDAWGEPTARTGTTALAFLWIGVRQYYFDLETGKLYVRERICDPVIARWTAVDLWFPNGQNRYEYSQNQPLMQIDPSGQWPLCSAEDCINSGPSWEASATGKQNTEGIYGLRVEVNAPSGIDCRYGGVIDFHFRENHLNPATGECFDRPADIQGELNRKLPGGFRFGDILARGCSRVTWTPRQVKGCWVIDFRWSCPLSCTEKDLLATPTTADKCGPKRSTLSIYTKKAWSRLQTLPSDVRPPLDLPFIIRIDTHFKFVGTCCRAEGCEIDPKIYWVFWEKEWWVGAGGLPKEITPGDLVDLEPAPGGGQKGALRQRKMECSNDEREFLWSV